MITTIYKCDRCGAEQNKPDQMWELGIWCKHLDATSSTVRNKQLWCRACCDRLQIVLTPQQKPNEPAPVIVSFEEQLRGIIRDEIQAATEEAR